jgi:hypothetical protein
VGITGSDRRIGNTADIRDFYFSLNLTPGDEIKENEMNGACGTYWRKEKYIQHFNGEA